MTYHLKSFFPTRNRKLVLCPTDDFSHLIKQSEKEVILRLVHEAVMEETTGKNDSLHETLQLLEEHVPTIENIMKEIPVKPDEPIPGKENMLEISEHPQQTAVPATIQFVPRNMGMKYQMIQELRIPIYTTMTALSLVRVTCIYSCTTEKTAVLEKTYFISRLCVDINLSWMQNKCNLFQL